MKEIRAQLDSPEMSKIVFEKLFQEDIKQLLMMGQAPTPLLALGKRIQSDAAHETLRWDKDDDDALDFVTAVSNLRAIIFGIPQKTRFDVKGFALSSFPGCRDSEVKLYTLIC
ncbi:E1 ubiquitin-activating protein uba2 [Puccinia graminis f. sp. tritici]|uniref:E1 ubiquitin-activating protein uba2 n=1 Tax=Puccinia graminis f. sp. tritici TaxID=56615 RepID=A0A5B0QSA2_PUCGR|nr:E1 ubiquitin-activating protein uba2 [Puccinia graminis f. sp. tritici]